MEYTKLKYINQYKSKSINPTKSPDTIFEMYSVPIYETGHPEYVRGDQIASNKLIVEKNDILLCKINPRINRVWIVSDESDKINIASSEWIVIRNKDINPEFLAWYFRSPKFKKLMISQVTGIGGSLTRAQPKCVSEYPVPVLIRDKQEKIVSILNKCKYIIDLKKNELLMLDELLQARFVEMFGDENNSKKWDVVFVEEVANVQVGVVIKPAQYYTDAGNGVRAFRSLNIGEGFVKDSDWVYFTEEGHKKNARSILEENDLLVVRSGTPGTSCVVTKEYVGCNAIDIIIARPDCEKVNPFYLCSFTNMPHGKRQISEGIGGAAQQHFNVSKYNQLKLMLPPKKLQDEFADFVRQTDKSKLALRSLHTFLTLYELHILSNNLTFEKF